MIAADEVGALERACICAGWRSLVSEEWAAPEVFAPEGEPVVVMVPQAWVDRGDRDLAFGTAMALLFLQRYRWLALVGVLVHMDDAAEFFSSRENAAD